MSEKIAVDTVTVTNAQGLHARPAEMFVKLASRFNSRIDITKDGETVDGKSILGILTLLAEQGTQLAIRAVGDDAEDALKALSQLVSEGFADDQILDQQ